MLGLDHRELAPSSALVDGASYELVAGIPRPPATGNFLLPGAWKFQSAVANVRARSLASGQEISKSRPWPRRNERQRTMMEGQLPQLLCPIN